MNVQQFRYALEIYNCRSMNKAAQRLFITQPALSQSIRDLEKDLGFTIFERSSKGVQPTPEGFTFLTSIHDFVKTIEQLQKDYSHDSDVPTALKVSSNRYTFVASAVIDFYNRHCKDRDRFSITLHEVDNTRVIEDVRSGRADFGVMHTMGTNKELQLQDFERKGLLYELISSSRSYIIFRKGHPLESKKTITAKDLLEYPQVRITTTDADPYDNYIGFNYQKVGESQRNFRADNRSQTYSIVGATDAVAYAVTSRDITRHYPNLVARRLTGDDTRYYLYVIWRERLHLGETEKDFIEILKSYGHD